MKKFFILFAAVLLTAMSVNVFAQSTGTTPAPGATHSYFITPGNAANEITWTVLKSDFSTPAGSDVAIDDATAATTDITWASGLTVGAWYYVQVIETDGDGCSNTKVLPVQITQSDFTLTLAAANPTACYDGAVSVSIVSNAPVYDHGNSTLVFTVTPGASLATSSYTGYTFNLNITVPTGYNATPAFSGNVTDFTAGTVTVNNNAAVTITYTIDNTNSYNNSSLANAQDYTATVAISAGKTINGVSENDTDDDNTDATAVSRPNTSGIGTN
jgi:hypothetical protein